MANAYRIPVRLSRTSHLHLLTGLRSAALTSTIKCDDCGGTRTRRSACGLALPFCQTVITLDDPPWKEGIKESFSILSAPRLGPYRHARPRSDPSFRYSRDFPTSSSYLPTLRILCTPCRNRTDSPSVKLTECSNTSMARPLKRFTIQRLTPSPWHAARYFSCRLPSSSSGRLLCHGDGALQGNRTHSYRRERPVS